MQASDTMSPSTVDKDGLARYWSCGGRLLDLSRPLIMGILNVTPDSFSDGGRHDGKARALDWAQQMVEDGADIIDIGGESTRPGAGAVSADEELRRVMPVLEVLCEQGHLVSVDTSQPEVMRRALQAGAAILNDVRAFEVPGALEVVAASTAGLVIMHGAAEAGLAGCDKGARAAGEADVVVRVEAYLRRREAALLAAGVDSARICWDAGFGFGKNVEENFAVLAATRRYAALGRPCLMGLSRKSSLGAVTGIKEPRERVAASVAGALLAAERGARILRVHDVRETRDALAVWSAVRSAEGG